MGDFLMLISFIFYMSLLERMSLLNNGTLANPTTAYYALKAESGSNWYQYPSQTGEVLLLDASGVQVLQSIDGNLFYNNELLAKAGELSNIADWSLYPAISTVLIANQNITQVNDIATTTVTATGVVSAGTLATVPGPYIAGNVKTNTLTASGQVSAGSVSASANIQGGSLTTTGGLDMANSAITRASGIALNNSGFPPYGQLTSPNGTLLTWNGQTVATGGGGITSNWSLFPAISNVDIANYDVQNVGTIGASLVTALNVDSSNVTVGGGTTGLLIANNITSLAGPADPPMVMTPHNGLTITADAGAISTIAASNISMRSLGGDIAISSYNNVSVFSGNDVDVLADGGLNPLITTAINLTAQNGNGGLVNITANQAAITPFGGKVSITANGGSITIPRPPPALPLTVTVGGEIDINANTGGGGVYTATSAIKLSAAGINSYAGAIPSIGSLLGYNFIYGTLGVSLCAGLPATGVQFPGTTYIYGIGVPGVAGGVRIQSPQGIQMLSDTYIENLYPLDGNGLTIQGRSLPTGYVTIRDVATLTTVAGSGQVRTDVLNSAGGLGIAYLDSLYPATLTQGVFANFLKPTVATAVGTPNLLIAGNSNFLGQQNYVSISNADTIAFDPAATGALSGVQSINGAAWPPSTGDASLWSQYPATSIVDISGYGLTNVSSLTGVSSINGQAFPISSVDWSLYPALQNVDLATSRLIHVADISMDSNAIITAAGQLSIIADLSGALILATNGGGDISIGTGNAADIYIQTGGAGNNIIIEGDSIGMTATVSIQANSLLDMNNNNIQEVATISGGGSNTSLTLSNASNGSINMLVTDGNLLFSTQNGIATINAGQDIRLNAIAGDINLDTQSVGGVINLLGTVEVGTVATQQNITVNGASQTTGDVIALFGGPFPVSLSTIGGLVDGISSAFRDSTEFYVSAQGSDVTGVGSILSPYATIQKAITQAELISSAALVCTINVASGHYTENLTFTRGYVVLSGSLQSQTGNEVCEITGSVSIALTGASDLFNRQVAFQGFNFSCGLGQAITNTSTTPHTVSFQDCKAFVNGQFYVSTSAAADARFYLTNVEISQFNAASTPSLSVIVTNIGLVELERVDITTDGNVSALAIGGTSVLSRCSLTTLEATSAATTLQPLLSITSTSTATHSLGNVAFAYSSAVVKTNTNAITIASGINTALIMLNCVFTLLGTASATNNCVGYNGVGSPTIAGINNTSLSINVVLPQTVSVQSGITQIQYINIQPPGLATYSSSVDQPIAVSGTPQALTFNTTQFNQGTTLLLNSRVYVNAQGNYNLNYSVELQHTGGAPAQNATTFLKKNGAIIANTGRIWTIPSGSYQIAAMAEFNVALNAGDYVEVFFLGDLTLLANASVGSGTISATPSVVFNIKQFR